MPRNLIIIIIGFTFLLGCKSRVPYSRVDQVLMADDLFPLKSSYDQPDWNFYRIKDSNNVVTRCNPFVQSKNNLMNDSLFTDQGKHVILSQHYEGVTAEILSHLEYYKIYKYGRNRNAAFQVESNYLAYVIIHQSDSVTYRFKLGKLPPQIKKLDNIIGHNFECKVPPKTE